MTSVLAFQPGPLSLERSRTAWAAGFPLLGLLLCTATPAVAQSGDVGDGTYQIGSPSLFGGISLSHDLSLNVPVRLGLYLNRNPSSGVDLPSFAPDYLASGVARDLLRPWGNTTSGWQDGFLMMGMLFEGGLPTQQVTLESFPSPSTRDAHLSFSIADLNQP